jgi:multicomponent Na+:H+ antiporter subunit C
MILVFSIAIGMLFMAGVYLILKHDLIRVVGGMVLISNAANLYILGSAVTRGDAPILPLKTDDTGNISDPVVQSLVLTAVVISFGVSALLLAIVYRVYLSHRTVDLEELSDHDIQQLNVEAAKRAEEGPMIADDNERGEEQES